MAVTGATNQQEWQPRVEAGKVFGADTGAWRRFVNHGIERSAINVPQFRDWRSVLGHFCADSRRYPRSCFSLPWIDIWARNLHLVLR